MELRDYIPPEILRTRLEELCLQIKVSVHPSRNIEDKIRGIMSSNKSNLDYLCIWICIYRPRRVLVSQSSLASYFGYQMSGLVDLSDVWIS